MLACIACAIWLTAVLDRALSSCLVALLLAKEALVFLYFDAFVLVHFSGVWVVVIQSGIVSPSFWSFTHFQHGLPEGLFGCGSFPWLPLRLFPDELEGREVRGRAVKCSPVDFSTWYLELEGSTVFSVVGRDHTYETVIAAEISVAWTSVVGRCNGRSVNHLLFNWQCSFTDDHTCH